MGWHPMRCLLHQHRTRVRVSHVFCTGAPCLSLHAPAFFYMLQVKIQALAFSPDEQRLVSLGGQDDNSLVRRRHSAAAAVALPRVGLDSAAASGIALSCQHSSCHRKPACTYAVCTACRLVLCPAACCAVLQVLWDVASGGAICGSPTNADFVLCCRFFSNTSDKLITAGNYNLQASATRAPRSALI